jgi:signal transduction histidine kinase
MQIFEYQLPLESTLEDEPETAWIDYETRLVISGPDEALGIVRNITERKQAERRLIRAERLAALGRLTAALAHEMNNPLQAMQSHLDLALDFPLPPAEKEDYLQIVRQEINRLTDVTRRVLNYARPQAKQPQRINLAELIEQVLVLAAKQLEQNKIKVTQNIQPVPAVLAASDQITQVFLNLVINAIEAMPQGGALLITLYQRQDHVITTFTNDGIPIPQEELQHIFEPFYTTKPEGNGLGLWVSHSLIQQHGGTLGVENLGGKQGIIVIVELPIPQEHPLENV